MTKMPRSLGNERIDSWRQEKKKKGEGSQVYQYVQRKKKPKDVAEKRKGEEGKL